MTDLDKNEKPILFSAPMIKAILAGKKTQTRRIMNPQPTGDASKKWPDPDRWALSFPKGRTMLSLEEASIACPYGGRGGALWVRETWYCDDYTAGDFTAARVGYVGKGPSDAEIIEKWKSSLDFRATHDCRSYEAGCPCADEDGRSGWRPSIFMPRWASRITLKIVEVRAERLMAITDQDAFAEGVTPATPDGYVFGPDDGKTNPSTSPRDAFMRGWDLINAERAAWATNPWVWVVSFKDVSP